MTAQSNSLAQLGVFVNDLRLRDRDVQGEVSSIKADVTEIKESFRRITKSVEDMKASVLKVQIITGLIFFGVQGILIAVAKVMLEDWLKHLTVIP